MVLMRLIWSFLRFSAEVWLDGMKEGLPTRLQIRILARSATAPHARLSARLSSIGALVFETVSYIAAPIIYKSKSRHLLFIRRRI